MRVDRSVQLCATCHTDPYPTYEEWLKSGPGHSQTTCNLCHTSHSQELKGANSTQVCAQCHQSHVDKIEQTKHGKANLECKTCHMYKQPADFINNIPAITGHTFFMTIEQLNCNSCHNVTLLKHNVLGVKSGTCLSCHGDIHELRLQLINGTTYSLNDPVALCGQCHNERLQAWQQGTHGSVTNRFASCTVCHQPHNPIVAGIATVPSIPDREFLKSSPSETISIIAVVVSLFLVLTFVFRRSF